MEIMLVCIYVQGLQEKKKCTVPTLHSATLGQVEDMALRTRRQQTQLGKEKQCSA